MQMHKKKKIKSPNKTNSTENILQALKT